MMARLIKFLPGVCAMFGLIVFLTNGYEALENLRSGLFFAETDLQPNYLATVAGIFVETVAAPLVWVVLGVVCGRLNRFTSQASQPNMDFTTPKSDITNA
jgi:hypothetical protein